MYSQHSISSITNKEFTANYEIGRHGDLLHKMHLEIDLLNKILEINSQMVIVLIQTRLLMLL